MTPAQMLQEIRQALGANPRLADLITQYGKAKADATLRETYTTLDPAILVHKTSYAKGIEVFTSEITSPHTPTRKPGRAPD